jgi:hypothetical protein
VGTKVDAKKIYAIPTGKRVTISKELELEIRTRFTNERENRFQLYVLSSGIRKKYLTSKGAYAEEFLDWYNKAGMKDLFGSIPNFTKYASCGDFVSWVGTKLDNPEVKTKQIPMSVGATYELFQILKEYGEDFTKGLFLFTPSRKDRNDNNRTLWTTKKPPLINKDATELKIKQWKRKWENPTQKQKRTDKRTLPMLTISVSGELFDFDKKSGDKVGNVDLPQVEDLFKKICELVHSHESQFKIDDKMDYLTEGYLKRKASNDPAVKLLKKQVKAKHKYR